MRCLVVLAALSLLSACWDGPALYADSDAVVAVPAGRYSLTTNLGEERPITISIGPTGLTEMTQTRRNPETRFGFAPLAGTRDFVAWWHNPQPDEPNTYAYGLLRPLEGGGYLLVFPHCSATRNIARRLGIDTGDAPHRGPTFGLNPPPRPPALLLCHFRDRATLEAGLRQLRLNPRELTDGMFRIAPLATGEGKAAPSR